MCPTQPTNKTLSGQPADHDERPPVLGDVGVWTGNVWGVFVGVPGRQWIDLFILWMHNTNSGPAAVARNVTLQSHAKSCGTSTTRCSSTMSSSRDGCSNFSDSHTIKSVYYQCTAVPYPRSPPFGLQEGLVRQ